MSKTYQNSNNFGFAVRRRKFGRREERGIALLLTIFGLLLLTAVAMSMMFSSDAETAISVNYRDSQIAGYAAQSALYEARDRIQPLSGDLVTPVNYLPTNTPDQGPGNGGYILYIINPGTNDTVATIAPWSPTIGGQPNPYFDAELCQENMFPGVVTAGTPGTPCAGATAIPAGACTNVIGGAQSWCRYYDNSANATNWQLKDTAGNKIPLDYKWVRISLKEDWNTPTYVPSKAAANGTQVCWDGVYQSQLPPNYNPATCYPNAGNPVIGLNLTAAGSGFTSAPTVTIAGGGGSGATATAQIAPAASDGIASVVITSAGSGYATPPTVSITPSGATFQAFVGASAITGVNINSASANYCYNSGVTPTVTFSTTPSTNTVSNATATPTMSSTGCVMNVSVTGTCKNTTAGKSYPFTSGGPPGGGTGFTGSATFSGGSGKTATISITNVGKSYSSGAATIGITDDTNKTCNITPTFTVGKQLSGITVSSGGAYMSQPSAALGGTAPAAPAAPVLPTLTAQPSPWPANAGGVTAVNVSTAGSGYTPGTHYPLTFTGGGGTGAAGYAVGGGTFVVSGLTLTSGGAGYTTAPNVTISGGGGTGSTALATIASGNVNTSMGQVYMLTSFAMTRSGSKSMAQMEAGARPPFTFNLGGAITLAGPDPVPNPNANPPIAQDLTFPNSNNFTVNGFDANSCGQTKTDKPAIGVWDSSSMTNTINQLGKTQNYTGVGGTPSVQVVYTGLGGSSATPSAIDGFVQSLRYDVTSPVLTGTVTSLPATTTSSVTFVDGDLTLSGNPTGNGVLVVTGTLTFSGNFTWNGLVLVVGQGQVVHNGGGNGTFTGAIYVAQTRDSSNNVLNSMSQGNPHYTWNGGGTNQIAYDHCLADGLLKKYQGNPSGEPLQVLSMRTLQY